MPRKAWKNSRELCQVCSDASAHRKKLRKIEGELTTLLFPGPTKYASKKLHIERRDSRAAADRSKDGAEIVPAA